MTHDERIEEVARAIWNAESVRAAGRARCIDWLDVSERHRSDYIFLATAAFAAAGVEEMVIAAAPDMLQEIATLRAELAEARNRISQLEAARIGYAKEFPVDDEGLPDAGSIHQNIRKLKAELAEARRERDRLREAVEQAPHAPTCQSLYIDIVGGLREPFSFEGLRHVARPCNCWKRAALEGKP
jgi:hypothetical protein